MLCRSGAWCGSWIVRRRFSQFVELHTELWARHTAALQRSRAALPSKWRLPIGGLELEGRERAPELHGKIREMAPMTDSAASLARP